MKVAASVHRKDEALWAYVGRTNSNLVSQIITGPI
jgi:hypothetical protein